MKMHPARIVADNGIILRVCPFSIKINAVVPVHVIHKQRSLVRRLPFRPCWHSPFFAPDNISSDAYVVFHHTIMEFYCEDHSNGLSLFLGYASGVCGWVFVDAWRYKIGYSLYEFRIARFEILKLILIY